MATSATAVVNVTAEAASRISQLGFQREVDSMIDYVCQNLPELTHIEVNLYDRYEMGHEPCLAIEAYSTRPFAPTDPAERAMDRWMITQFPPEILQHVLVTYRPGAVHGG